MWFSAALPRKRRVTASAPWRLMGPLAVVHVLMLASAAFGLHSIAREVDRSDALRAEEAVTAAFNFQLNRLEMVTLNNAVYTEAWKAVGGTQVNSEWALENWTVAPPDLPGHHGILLVEPDGRPIIGTRAGRPLTKSAMLNMALLVRPTLRKLPTHGEASVKGLINTGPVPLLVAAANVLPEPSDRTPEHLRGPKRRLVLIHPINANLLATMNQTIGGERLRLGSAGLAGNEAHFTADSGNPVFLNWRSRQPGQAAMMRSLWIIVPVLLIVTVLLLAAMKAGAASNHALKLAATIDQLTQLPNRASFSAELDYRISTGLPFALGIIDLDDFKTVNDQHGHLVGDDLLTTFGQILAGVSEPHDVVFRLGGDEFAFLTENREAADRMSIRLRLELSRPLMVQPDFTLRTEASIGIAIAAPGETSKDVMANADTELYADKRRRRAQETPAASQNPDHNLSVGKRA